MSQDTTAPTSHLLQRKLAGVRDKHLYVGVGAGIAWLIVAAVILLAAGMWLDWIFEFSRDTRLLLLVLDAGVLATIFVKHIFGPLTNRPNYEEVALEVERALPEFRSRLIASTQMNPEMETDATAASFVRALVSQTEQLAGAEDFNRVVPSDGFAKAAVWAVLIGGLGYMAYGKYQPDTGDLLQRAFLDDRPVPRFTHIAAIEVEPKTVLARGDNVTIHVKLDEKSRVKPETAVIAIGYASASRATPHTRTNANNTFTLHLENVRESFTIEARANDGTATESVEVVPRPAVRTIEFTQKYPSYTGLKDQPRQRGDLMLLLGSELKVRVTTNKKVVKGTVFLVSSAGEVAQELPLSVPQGGGDTVSASLLLDDLHLTGFSVRLEDEHGFTSQDEALYRLTLLPDKPPIVRVLEPVRREEKVTQRARLPIMVSVKDDYGVDQLVLKYHTGDGVPQSVPLKPESAIGRLARVPFDWKIRDLQMPVGTVVTYWVEAMDAKAPEPGVSKSRELTALVVTDDEKRRDLQNRATDSITGINATAEQQQKLNQELGEIIRAQAITSEPNNE